ncbi:TonB-dependent receptor [Paraburkholderia phymatum]|nr:TonB-dependent receptor [Paraburkholderia phymatum]
MPRVATNDLLALPLEQLMQVSVSSATRLEQRISDAPAAVVVLTASDIRDFGWKTLADALASLPGLYTTYDRNYAYLGARGFQRPGDYNSRFLLLVDGVRINDAVYDQAPIGTDFPVDMDLVERIEYVPGPGSAVYGSNALFGIINVITRSGRNMAGAQAAAAAGSFGEKKARATYGWHGAHGADVLLSASSWERNGQDLYFPAFDTPDQNHGVANGLDYDRGQNLLGKAAYGDFGISAGYSNRTKGVPGAPYGAIFNTPFSTTDTHAFINGTFHHAITSGFEVAAKIDWGRYDYRSPSLYAPGPVENVDGDHALWYGADVNATIRSIRNNTLIVGVDYTRDAHRDQYNFDVAPFASILDDHRSSHRSGVYAEDEIRLPAGFTLNLGLRYDHEAVAGSNVSPRVALSFKATSADTLKLVYGTAYRAPNAYELYYAVPGEGGQLPNPGLKAEHIRTTELIYEHAFGPTGRATLSVFHYDIRNLISETLDPSGLYIFRNVDRSKANGAELGYEQQFAGGARVRASYSWQIARDSGTGSVMQNSPRHLAKLNMVLPLLTNRARLGTEMRCVSSRLAERGHAAGYCIGNVSIGSARLIPHADVSLSIYNVTDTRYFDPAGPGYTQDVIAQQSRSFLLKLVYGF